MELLQGLTCRSCSSVLLGLSARPGVLARSGPVVDQMRTRSLSPRRDRAKAWDATLLLEHSGGSDVGFLYAWLTVLGAVGFYTFSVVCSRTCAPCRWRCCF